jgi:alpha-glucosidase
MNISVRRRLGLTALFTTLFTTLVAPQALAQSAIPQSNWTLNYVDSQDTNGGDYGAVNAFDGDPATMWVTEWYLSSPWPPHEIRINLGASYDVTGFRYLPRQDGLSHGNIAQYAFYVSADGVTWGSAVATGTFSDGSHEQQVLFTAKRGQYIRLRALTEVNGAPWSVVAELSVLATGTPPGGGGVISGTTIPQGAWTLHSVDSQETGTGNYRATAAFDGNRDTMWVTQWLQSSPPPPHDIQINLGGTYNINGFRYLPRQDGQPFGSIGEYRFYVSTDGVNWGSAVASGNFANSAAEQQVTFSTTSGRYVRLHALTEIGGYPWTTVAELNVLTSSPVPPSPPANQPPSVSRAVFTPSSDHATLVQHYVIDVFPSGVDVTAANPVASVDIGRPTIVNGECQADISGLLASLPSGSYVATVTAVGWEGAAQSAPSPQFNR